VGIGAWDLSVQLRPRWPGGRRVATKSYALHPPQDTAEVGKALANAIQRIVGDGAVPASARVMLADHWAHYALISGDFRSMKTRDTRLLAREYLQSALDTREATVAIGSEVLRGGRRLFAAGIDSALLQSIQRTLAARDIRLRSTSTWFAAVAPNWRQQMPAGRCAVACEFGGTLQLMLADGDRWEALTTDTVRRPTVEALRARVDLFLRRFGESADSVALAIAAPLLAESATARAAAGSSGAPKHDGTAGRTAAGGGAQPPADATKTSAAGLPAPVESETNARARPPAPQFARLKTPQVPAGHPLSLALVEAVG
jgi:hypothetical protein